MANKLKLKGLKPPYFFHCALSKVNLDNLSGERLTRSEFIEAHLHSIENKFGRENLIFPSFNFDFKETGEYRPQKDDTFVGALSNHLIGKDGFYRSHTPFFSCISPNREFIHNYVDCTHYQPFSEESVFGDLYHSDGSIILYGTDVPAATFYHFISHFAGPPIFRYDKRFQGKVITDSTVNDVEVTFHVRPLGLNLEYDWQKVERILKNAGALVNLAPNITGISARVYTETIGILDSREDFPLLDEPTRKIVKKKYAQLGRRFELSDFEI